MDSEIEGYARKERIVFHVHKERQVGVTGSRSPPKWISMFVCRDCDSNSKKEYSVSECFSKGCYSQHNNNVF